LGGNKLTADTSDYFMINVNSTSKVTIKNGSIYGESSSPIAVTGDVTIDSVNVGIGSTGKDRIIELDSGKLTVKNSTIKTPGSENIDAILSFDNGNTVVLQDTTITVGGWAVYHNGSYYGFTLSATDCDLTSLTAQAVYISGSTTTTQNNGGKNQQATFTGCTITGTTGVEGKFTDMEFTDCTVTATADEPSFVQYNNGSTSDGFAVVSTDNSMKPDDPTPSATITINSGTYTGLVGLSQFLTTINFKDATYTIKGGTFSSDPSAYVDKNNYDVTEVGKTYTVGKLQGAVSKPKNDSKITVTFSTGDTSEADPTPTESPSTEIEKAISNAMSSSSPAAKFSSNTVVEATGNSEAKITQELIGLETTGDKVTGINYNVDPTDKDDKVIVPTDDQGNPKEQFDTMIEVRYNVPLTGVGKGSVVEFVDEHESYTTGTKTTKTTYLEVQQDEGENTIPYVTTVMNQFSKVTIRTTDNTKTAVATVNGVKYYDLQDAINQVVSETADKGGTIVLVDDVVGGNYTAYGQTIKLEVGNYKWQPNSFTSGTFVLVDHQSNTEVTATVTATSEGDRSGDTEGTQLYLGDTVDVEISISNDDKAYSTHLSFNVDLTKLTPLTDVDDLDLWSYKVSSDGNTGTYTYDNSDAISLDQAKWTFRFEAKAVDFTDESITNKSADASITFNECRVAGNTWEKSTGIEWPKAETTDAVITIIPKPIVVKDIPHDELKWTGEELHSNIQETDEYKVITQASGTDRGKCENGVLEAKPGYCWGDDDRTIGKLENVYLLLIVNASEGWDQLPKINNDPVPYGTEVEKDDGIPSATGSVVTVEYYEAKYVDLEKGELKEGATPLTDPTDEFEPGEYVAVFTATLANHDDETCYVPFTVAEPDFKVLVSRNYIWGYSMIYVFSQNDTTKFSYKVNANDTNPTEMSDITALGYKLYLDEKGNVGSLTATEQFTEQYEAKAVYGYLVLNDAYTNIKTNIDWTSGKRDTDKVIGVNTAGAMDVNTNSKINLTDASNVKDVSQIVVREGVTLESQLTGNLSMGMVFHADVNRDGIVSVVDDATPIIQHYLVYGDA
jgi:hypothetical protein